MKFFQSTHLAVHFGKHLYDAVATGEMTLDQAGAQMIAIQNAIRMYPPPSPEFELLAFNAFALWLKSRQGGDRLNFDSLYDRKAELDKKFAG